MAVANQPANLAEAMDSAARRKLALEMRLVSASYEKIAERTGLKRSAVGREIRKALTDIPLLAVAEYRKVSVERLDLLARAYWGRALKGDLRAAQLLLKIEDARNELLGTKQKGDPTLADVAKALPPGARFSMEKQVSAIWQDEQVVGAVQLAYRQRAIETTSRPVEPTPVPDTVTEEAERLAESDDPDAVLYAQVWLETAGVAQPPDLA